MLNFGVKPEEENIANQILSTFKFTQTQNVDSKNTKKIGYIKSIKPNYDNYALDIDYVCIPFNINFIFP